MVTTIPSVNSSSGTSILPLTTLPVVTRNGPILPQAAPLWLLVECSGLEAVGGGHDLWPTAAFASGEACSRAPVLKWMMVTGCYCG
jgi:hypothetical protein